MTNTGHVTFYRQKCKTKAYVLQLDLLQDQQYFCNLISFLTWF